MSEREVLFGIGDLADRMAALVSPESAPEDDRTLAPGDQRAVYVHVGQLYACAESRLMATVLGSCVAVCLWDPTSGAGGLNHYLLPHGSGHGAAALRYGNGAIEQLIGEVVRHGGERRRLKAKVFGGASVIDAFHSSRRSLGMENVEQARRLLQDAAIPIVGEDTGGTQGRKLKFQIPDGTAWVRRL